jgi:hypothetical protein
MQLIFRSLKFKKLLRKLRSQKKLILFLKKFVKNLDGSNPVLDNAKIHFPKRIECMEKLVFWPLEGFYFFVVYREIVISCLHNFDG